jgi:hypothetical protein
MEVPVIVPFNEFWNSKSAHAIACYNRPSTKDIQGSKIMGAAFCTPQIYPVVGFDNAVHPRVQCLDGPMVAWGWQLQLSLRSTMKVFGRSPAMQVTIHHHPSILLVHTWKPQKNWPNDSLSGVGWAPVTSNNEAFRSIKIHQIK